MLNLDVKYPSGWETKYVETMQTSHQRDGGKCRYDTGLATAQVCCGQKGATKDGGERAELLGCCAAIHVMGQPTVDVALNCHMKNAETV